MREDLIIPIVPKEQAIHVTILKSILWIYFCFVLNSKFVDYLYMLWYISSYSVTKLDLTTNRAAAQARELYTQF